MTSNRLSRHRGVALLCALLLHAAGAAAEALGGSLEALLSYAHEHNPELRARTLEADAARERVGPAGALPDPRFQLELMDFTNTANGRDASLLPGEVGMTRYRVIQPLPYWGKRELRAELARARARQSDESTRISLRAVESRIKVAFARYYEMLGRDRIQRDTLGLLEALEQLVLTRYSVGLVPQQDALRAQGEITRLKIDLIETERLAGEARARLNAALPRPADAPLSAPAELPPVRESLQLAALASRARENSPELAALRAGVDTAAASRDVAYRERYPDFALGLTNNRPRNGDDTWDLMIELNIPLQQSRRRSEERLSERQLDASGARLAEAEARIDGRLGELLAAFESTRSKARLLEHTLLPQARATLEAAEAGYATGSVNFDTLIEAERQILRTRLALLEAEVEARVRQAEMEQIVGEAL